MSANRSNDDLDALADRLRGLPPPPVPAGLEAKLLAAIPPAGSFQPAPRSRGRRHFVVGGALAAAAVLLALLLRGFFGETAAPPPRPTPPVAQERRPAGFDSPGRVDSDPAQVPSSFEWPVQLTVPAAARHFPDELTD